MQLFNLTAALVIMTALSAPTSTWAQGFTRITDLGNPVATDSTITAYTGCAWGDYDGDGREDLLVVNQNANFLYHNDGGGAFTRLTAVDAGAISSDPGLFRGVAWGDYDNDGDLDCFIAGNTSGLYRNNGAPPWFTKVTVPDIGTTDTRGWSPGWGDYDNDGNIDLIIAFPTGFVPAPGSKNQMFHNDGPPNYTFTRVDTGAVVSEFEPFTSLNWSDYDLDGDIDLFIGSGPASPSPAPDFLYHNHLIESGTAGFTKITTAPIATDVADGQVWNWVDYDNDGDLDAYRTNWGGASPGIRPNDLYRNDGGVYTQITTGAIATDAFISLANIWEDFDNDGDRDCFVTNDNNARNSYYHNNGDGTFTSLTLFEVNGEPTSSYGATAGDMDEDGDLDLFVAGVGASRRYLLRNDTDGLLNWLKIKCVGQQSNGAAIGATIWLWATINGIATRQHREIQTQNSFLCHNSLIVHFGLGDATVIDSFRVEWPSGSVTDSANVPVNQTLTIVEVCADPDGDGISCFDNCPALANPDQADADNDGIGDACQCVCDCHADPGACDGFRDIVDVVQVINVAFRALAAIPDPNVNCDHETTDVDCTSSTDIIDVVKTVNVAFRNASPAAEFCQPCP